MNISAPVKAAALAHAQAELPREACGLVVVVAGQQIYWPCRNIFEAPEGDDSSNGFTIDPADFCGAEDSGEVVAWFHSHPTTPPEPSDLDRASCELSGVPWLIVNPRTLAWAELAPCGYQQPLLGRQWLWGVADCWTLGRDWYRLEMGVVLPEFERPATLAEFEKNPLFEHHWQEAGFERVAISDLQYGDALLMAIGNQRLNHLGIYVGDQRFVHHQMGHLSSRDLYDQYWQNATGLALRLQR